MMRQTASFGYAKGTGYQAVELLYDGSEISHGHPAPDKGNFDPFEKSLNAELIGRISKDLETQPHRTHHALIRV